MAQVNFFLSFSLFWNFYPKHVVDYITRWNLSAFDAEEKKAFFSSRIESTTFHFSNMPWIIDFIDFLCSWKASCYAAKNHKIQFRRIFFVLFCHQPNVNLNFFSPQKNLNYLRIDLNKDKQTDALAVRTTSSASQSKFSPSTQ